MKEKGLLCFLLLLSFFNIASAAEIISPALVPNSRYFADNFENYCTNSDCSSIKDVWGEESGNWSIVNTTNEKGKPTTVYMRNDARTGEYKYNFNKNKQFLDTTYSFKFKNLAENSTQRIRFHFRVKDSSHFYTLQYHSAGDGMWYLMKDSNNDILGTCRHEQLSKTWHWAKIISNKDNLSVYYSDNGIDWNFCNSSIDSSYFSGYIGLGSYSDSANNPHVFDDFLIREHFRNALNVEDSNAIASTYDELTASYLYTGNSSEFVNETIEFYRNGNLTYSIFNEEYNSKNKNLPASYTSVGDVWNANITVCDIDGCESAITQNVMIANSLPYFIGKPAISNEEPYIGEAVECKSNAFDPDNDDISSSWAWYKNGKKVAGQTRHELNLTLRDFRKGDNITCSQKICDASGCSEWQNSSSVEIKNYVPRVSKIEVLPGTLYKERAYLSIEVFDADNETLSARLTLNDANGTLILNNTLLAINSSLDGNITWHSLKFFLNSLGNWNFLITVNDGYETRKIEDRFYVPFVNYAPEISFSMLLPNNQYFFENFEMFNSAKDIWDEKSGNWSIINTTDENGNLIKAYQFEGILKDNFQYSHIKDIKLANEDNFTLIFSVKNLEGEAYISFCGECNSMRPRIIFGNGYFYCLEDVSLNSTLEYKDLISRGEWRKNYKAEKNGDKFNLYLSDGTLACSLNFPKTSLKGLYFGGYSMSKAVYDDIFFLKDSQNEIKINNNLSAIYLYSDKNGDKLRNATIRWYKNNVLQENLTKTITDFEKDFGDKNTLDSKYISAGEMWHAIVTICDDILCSSASTQKIRIAEEAVEIKEKSIAKKIGSSITGLAVSGFGGNSISSGKLILVPAFLIIFFVIEFIVNEIKIAKNNRKNKNFRLK